MICVHSAKLPHASVARYVLVIVYLFAQVCALITSLIWLTVIGPPQLSLTPVTASTFTGGTALAQLTVTGAGHVNAGGVWSLTVIICVHSTKLPEASVARYVLVII